MSGYTIDAAGNVLHEGPFTFEFPTAQQAASFAEHMRRHSEVTSGHRVVDVWGEDLETVAGIAARFGGRQA